MRACVLVVFFPQTHLNHTNQPYTGKAEQQELREWHERQPFKPRHPHHRSFAGRGKSFEIKSQVDCDEIDAAAAAAFSRGGA